MNIQSHISQKTNQGPSKPTPYTSNFTQNPSPSQPQFSGINFNQFTNSKAPPSQTQFSGINYTRMMIPSPTHSRQPTQSGHHHNMLKSNYSQANTQQVSGIDFNKFGNNFEQEKATFSKVKSGNGSTLSHIGKSSGQSGNVQGQFSGINFNAFGNGSSMQSK
jgi:hypothetical protein